jgi:hypothetical protein
VLVRVKYVVLWVIVLDQFNENFVRGTLYKVTL